MDTIKLLEALAPPQDCATCEHLDLSNSMPLTGPPIPVAACPMVHVLETHLDAHYSADLIKKYRDTTSYWAGDLTKCPSYSRAYTREELLERIASLETEVRDLQYRCEAEPDEDEDREGTDWHDLD